ncbi:endonuclease domain-containing protein [Sphingomonas qomolangmaensis]|nr:DUF559 domain-containing protein [Sphingomonas qomolangmaensis]
MPAKCSPRSRAAGSAWSMSRPRKPISRTCSSTSPAPRMGDPASTGSPSPLGEGLGWGSADSTGSRLQSRAREMRNNPTEWENRLWRCLSNRQLGDFKFRRQAVIGNRVVDFFCPSVGLVIEVDGDTHDLDRDAQRDEMLKANGLSVLRVSNRDVAENQSGVLEAVLALAQSLPPRSAWRLPHPNPVSGRSGPRPDLNRAGHGLPDTPEGEGL